ncbi:MAG TPA: hypothetical protein PK695_04895 [Chitinophagaceae bacterium]|nr:MAG: hypothetical protein BWZ05_00490 [Bacteroidetes bacterium ADurb.BinA245]HMW65701.1 hypothetical protein [Chitinophagaceae bacterium]HNA92123.1 hypothetical protein [Chitinophagaceae bacterium]HNC38064.1 hypothetical protein [Chitinophagaceae bacterium]HNF37309.1 hypothetical protein [Chitinophagaceae bacterium]
MTGIFKTKNPANFFLLLVLAIVLKLPLFYTSSFDLPKTDDDVLYQSLLSFLNSKTKIFPKLYPFLSLLLLFTQALMFNSFINRQKMTGRQTFLPAMSYLLLTSLLPDWNYFSAPLLVNTIFIFILSSLFQIYNNEKAKGIIFNAGFAGGVAVFLYFPSLLFGIWMLLALMIMRPFKINEWILCIVGISTPFYFYGIYLFIRDQWSWGALFSSLHIKLPSIAQSLWLAISVFLIVVPFLMGAFYVQDNLRKMLIQVRKGWTILLLYLLVSLFIPLAGENQTFENWIIAAVPFAGFHACAYLYTTYRIVPILIFWASVAFILVWQYAGPVWH